MIYKFCDPISQEDVEITKDTVVYYVKQGAGVVLRAIQRSDVAKLGFDPLTRESKGWIIANPHHYPALFEETGLLKTQAWTNEALEEVLGKRAFRESQTQLLHFSDVVLRRNLNIGSDNLAASLLPDSSSRTTLSPLPRRSIERLPWFTRSPISRSSREIPTLRLQSPRQASPIAAPRSQPRRPINLFGSSSMPPSGTVTARIPDETFRIALSGNSPLLPRFTETMRREYPLVGDSLHVDIEHERYTRLLIDIINLNDTSFWTHYIQHAHALLLYPDISDRPEIAVNFVRSTLGLMNPISPLLTYVHGLYEQDVLTQRENANLSLLRHRWRDQHIIVTPLPIRTALKDLFLPIISDMRCQYLPPPMTPPVLG